MPSDDVKARALEAARWLGQHSAPLIRKEQAAAIEECLRMLATTEAHLERAEAEVTAQRARLRKAREMLDRVAVHLPMAFPLVQKIADFVREMDSTMKENTDDE